MNSNAPQISLLTETLLTYLHRHRDHHPKTCRSGSSLWEFLQASRPYRSVPCKQCGWRLWKPSAGSMRAACKRKSYNYFPSFRKYSTAADPAQLNSGLLALLTPSQTPAHLAARNNFNLSPKLLKILHGSFDMIDRFPESDGNQCLSLCHHHAPVQVPPGTGVPTDVGTPYGEPCLVA